jgi:hypothetical protein
MKKIEEGVFYPESMALDCCEKCGDVYFEKTYPAHTAYHACTNLKCNCHVAPTSEKKEVSNWEEEFLAILPILTTNLTPDSKLRQIKVIVSKLLQTAREESNKSLGGAIEMSKQGWIEEGRLSTLKEVREVVEGMKHDVHSEGDGETREHHIRYSGHNNALDDLLQKLQEGVTDTK